MFHFDLFFLEHLYPFFNKILLGRFVELMRYLSSNFMVREEELLLIKMNLHLIDKEIEVNRVELVDEFLIDFVQSQINGSLELTQRLINLILLFFNAKILAKEESQRFQFAQHLSAYYQMYCIKNLPQVFNQWCITSKFSP